MELKEKKVNQSSLRYTDTVAKIINDFEGKYFAEKFENLVLHCYTELPKLNKEIEDKQNQLAYKQQELENIDNEIRKHKSILKDLQELENTLKRLIEKV